MSLDQMRSTLLTAYSGEKWKKKVSAMSNGQVIAVYYKFLAEKKFKLGG